MRTLGRLSTRIPLALVGCAEAPEAQLQDAAAWNTDLQTQMAPPPVELDLFVLGDAVAGSSFDVTVTGALPGETVTLIRTDGDVGDGPCIAALGGQCLDVEGPFTVMDTAVADAAGVATFTVSIPAAATIGNENLFFAGSIRGSGGADSVVSDNIRLRISDGSARLRVVHASPDAPAVDIYADGGLLVPDVAYTEAAGYLSVPPGTYDIDIVPEGAPLSASVSSFPLTLDAATDYTAVATGFLGSTDPADSFRVLALAEEPLSPTNGTFDARLVHASPSAPTVDIDVFDDGTTDLPGVPRFADAAVQLPSGPAFQTRIIDPVSGLSFPFTVGAPTGEDLMVIAVGDIGSRANQDDGFALLVVDDGDDTALIRQNPELYALHASPDAPAVDLSSGGAVLETDLAFRELSSKLELPPGSYTVDVDIAGGGGFFTSFDTPDLMAGERYLAIATGFAFGSPAFTVIPVADPVDEAPSDVFITAVHASPDAPAVDVGVDAGGTFVSVFPSLAFGDFASGAVAPDTYSLAVALPGDTTPLFSFPALPLSAGDRWIGVAEGDLGAADFGLSLVDTTAEPWTVTNVSPL